MSKKTKEQMKDVNTMIKEELQRKRSRQDNYGVKVKELYKPKVSEKKKEEMLLNIDSIKTDPFKSRVRMRQGYDELNRDFRESIDLSLSKLSKSPLILEKSRNN